MVTVAPPRLWSTEDVVVMTGATYRQLDHWERTGRLVPSVPASGSGSRRGFDDDNVRAVAVLTAIADAVGLDRAPRWDQVCEMVARRRRWWWDPVAGVASTARPDAAVAIAVDVSAALVPVEQWLTRPRHAHDNPRPGAVSLSTRCPRCAAPFVAQCRCPFGDRRCRAGHWYHQVGRSLEPGRGHAMLACADGWQ